MGRKVAPSQPETLRVSRLPRHKPGRGQGANRIAAEAPRPPKPPARSTIMRLAAEVDRLAAQLHAAEARVAELETRIDIDPLTGTFNRRGFERELKRSLAYVKRYGTSAALIYIDLDEFKPVNDRHGHAAGDAALAAIASALLRHVRASDVVARIGGDEFAVLLWNVDALAAEAKAAALENAICATQLRWGDATLAVGASAGVALLGVFDAPAEILARADAAMYTRKAGRRQRLIG